MKIAIAHDYLTQRGGAERVALSLARAFPGAPLYTTLYHPEGTFPEFADVDVRTSPLNRVAPLRRHHRWALPLLPAASSRIHIDADVVVASSTGWAHGFTTTGRTLVYCHSPARWLYVERDYVSGDPEAAAKRVALACLRSYLTSWDRRAAFRADAYLANSTVVAERIARVYGLSSTVVHPPHTVNPEGPSAPVARVLQSAPGGFHLVVSRLMPYKHVGTVLDAFAQLPDEHVVVVGDGPLRGELEASAPPNATFLRRVDDDELRWLYAHARGLVAASHEDFGLTPIEAFAAGCPVIALRAGGYLDSMVEGVTGVFFDEVDAGAIAAAVADSVCREWNQHALRRRAADFAEPAFQERIRRLVTSLT